MSFKSWVADGITSKKHIEEVIRKNHRKELMELRDRHSIDIDDLAQDCWIYIRDHSETRGECREHLNYYSGKVISTNTEERFARQTTKLAVSWYVMVRLKDARKEASDKRKYREYVMLSGQIEEEKYDSDLLSSLTKATRFSREETIIFLWHNHLMPDDKALGLLKLSSRKSLYNRLYKALDKLSAVYHKKEYIQPPVEKSLSLSELLALMNTLRVGASAEEIESMLNKAKVDSSVLPE